MQQRNTVNIGLADSQSIFCDGLSLLIQQDSSYRIKWHISSGDLLKNTISKDEIDVLIMEICLHKTDGIDMINQLKSLYPDLSILILSQYSHSKFIKTSFLEGADGYILKSDTKENLFNALDTILRGKTFMGNGISIGPKRTKNSPHNKKEWACEDAFLLKHELTNRESEVLLEICSGKTNKEIAKELFISDQTVSVHRKNIMRKFNVNSTNSLKKVAKQLNLHDTLSPV